MRRSRRPAAPDSEYTSAWWNRKSIGEMVTVAAAPHSCASFCVGLVFLFVALSPSGRVGSVTEFLIGGMMVVLSLHPNSRFYEGCLGTTQRRGPEFHPRGLYRILCLVFGSFVIWDCIWQFLRYRGQVRYEPYRLISR